MTSERYDEILDAIKARATWETKQLNWYAVRHTGYKRAGKPYPGAPDMHFPLADSLIERLKAFYVQLIYAQETLASFICKKAGQAAALTTAVGQWFDYKLKQGSNFEREVMIAIDQMLQNGHQIVKVRWDSDNKQLAFDARDPLYIIVPKGTQELKDADWLIDVIPMSEEQYRANPNFKQDEDFIQSIKGRGDNSESGISTKAQAKELREGITYSKDENQIIVWECHIRDRINKRITLETISPLLGYSGDKIREDFVLPYDQGLFKTGERFPYMKFRTEIKDKGHFSERGIPEVVFQFEQLLNKTWNTQCTWMDFYAQPMFKQTQTGVASTHNWKSGPGKVLPFGLDSVGAPEAPNSLKEQMQFGRALAEYRVSIPDLSGGQHLTPYAQSEGGKKTAREVSAVMDLSGMTNDVRARVFRLDFGELLNLAWSLLLQYAKDDLSYVLQDELITMDQAALHEDYEIRPNGSPDSWNKAGQLQKAVARFGQFNNDPYIDQGELRKSVLELDDPSLIKRLFRDPGETSKEQAEQQAVECVLMMFGWPAKTNMADDDKAHLLTLAQFVEDKIQRGQMTPELAKLCLDHGAKHIQQLQQKKDPMARQIEAQIRPLAQILQQIVQSQLANVVPMQQQSPVDATASTAEQVQQPQQTQ